MITGSVTSVDSIAIVEVNIEQENYNNVDEIKLQLDRKNYKNSLQKMEVEKGRIAAIESAATKFKKGDSLLYQCLIQDVFPAWYETPWDFNGISDVPGEGEIACGYFVSTTLKHVGFNLNRYKVAQQAASVIIEAICSNDHINRFGLKEGIIDFLSEKENGLYVVGLDFHVGFLQVENGKVHFIHSDYFNVKVVKELAIESTGFSATNAYVLGSLTGNRKLIQKWFNGQRIYK